MKKEIRNIDDEVNKTLGCMGPVEFSKPLDDFYSMVESRLYSEQIPKKKNSFSVNVGYIVIFIILFLNIILVFSLINDASTSQKVTTSNKVLDDYSTIQIKKTIY